MGKTVLKGKATPGMRPKLILIVDDEATICDTVCAVLAHAGYEAEAASTLSQAQQSLERRDFDLVLLDIILVGESGLDLLPWLREERRREVPVVLLSGVAREDTKLKAFRLGADDYVVKPFSSRELVARVKAVLRRSGKGGVVHFGPYRLDLEAHQLYRGSEPVKLRPKEFDMLAALASQAGEALTNEEMHRMVWATTHTRVRSVATMVHTLRQLLEDDPSQPRYLCSVPKFGYRLDVEAKR